MCPTSIGILRLFAMVVACIVGLCKEAFLRSCRPRESSLAEGRFLDSGAHVGGVLVHKHFASVTPLVAWHLQRAGRILGMRPLFAVVDLMGATVGLTLVPGVSPPSIAAIVEAPACFTQSMCTSITPLVFMHLAVFSLQDSL